MFKYLVRSWWFLRRYPVIPIFILILLLIAAAIGPYVTPYERDIGNIADRHLEPFSTSENSVAGKGWITNSDGTMSPTQIVNGYHVLGTDHVGRDIFTRLLHGSRINIYWNGVRFSFSHDLWVLRGTGRRSANENS